MFYTFFAEIEARYRHERLLEETLGVGPAIHKTVQEARMMQLAQQTQAPAMEHDRRVSAYVFVSCAQPKRLARALRRLPGVIKADALLGASEAVLVVERHNFEALQSLLAEVQSTPGVRKISVKLAA